MQPRILGILECAAASAAQTKLRATEGAQLRLKTYVRRNSPQSRNVFQESCSSYESLKSKPIATPIRAAFRVSLSAFSGRFLPWSAGSTCLEHVQKDSAQWRRIRTTSPNCTLSAAASLRSVLGFPRSRHFGRSSYNPSSPQFLCGLASLQPCARGSYRARLQPRSKPNRAPQKARDFA